MIETLTELIHEDSTEFSDFDVALVVEKATKIVEFDHAEKLLRKAHLAIKDYYEKSGKRPAASTHGEALPGMTWKTLNSHLKRQGTNLYTECTRLLGHYCPYVEDLTGQQFGRLVVLKQAPPLPCTLAVTL